MTLRNVWKRTYRGPNTVMQKTLRFLFSLCGAGADTADVRIASHVPELRHGIKPLKDLPPRDRQQIIERLS